MPDYSLFIGAQGDDFDPEHSAGRFNRRPAIAVLTPEADWESYGSAEDAVRAQAGDWLLETDPKLGEPRTHDGSVGRGAEGWVPVVEWAVDAVGQGVVDLMLAGAVAAVVKRLRARRPPDENAEAPSLAGPRFYISRGVAAAVAADDVANFFGDQGRLEVEAIEEPSSIAGLPVIETSYVGLEPWVVLLRNVERERRYYVVVSPEGEVMARAETALLPWEKMYLRPVQYD